MVRFRVDLIIFSETGWLISQGFIIFSVKTDTHLHVGHSLPYGWRRQRELCGRDVLLADVDTFFFDSVQLATISEHELSPWRMQNVFKMNRNTI